MKAICNKCMGSTNHLVLYEEDMPWSELIDEVHGFEISGSDNFTLIKCLGCDSVKLMHKSWFSETTDDSGRPHINTNYYPPAISRPEPPWFKELIFTQEFSYIVSLLREIYSALHNDSLRLVAMGARSLLEYIMVNKVEDRGSFKKNLDEFCKQGYLSNKQAESIETILEVGHATIHRGFDPQSKDINTIIDITESLIATIYVHSNKALELKNRVPKRNIKKK